MISAWSMTEENRTWTWICWRMKSEIKSGCKTCDGWAPGCGYRDDPGELAVNSSLTCPGKDSGYVKKMDEDPAAVLASCHSAR